MTPDANSPLGFLQRSIEELQTEERKLEEDITKLAISRAQIREQLARLQAAIVAFKNAETQRIEQPPTIQAGVLRILDEFPNGLPALRILDELKVRFGMNYPRTSLSPQLSRLKAQGKVKLNGNIWSKTRK